MYMFFYILFSGVNPTEHGTSTKKAATFFPSQPTAHGMTFPQHLVVRGAGVEDLNGVFSMQEGISHENCPVYGNLSDFSLSCCQSADGSGDFGWILGQGGVPAYGSMSQHKEIPTREWQCFEGPLPAPTVDFIDDPDALAEAYAEEARLRVQLGDGDMNVTIKALRRAIDGKKLQGNWQGRAKLHVELAQVLYSSGQADKALKEVELAQNFWPSFPEALLLKAQLHGDALRSESHLAVQQCKLAAAANDESCTKESLAGILKRCDEVLLEMSEMSVISRVNLRELLDLATLETPELDLTSSSQHVHIAAIVAEGCNLSEVNGIYEPSRVISNQQCVFENSHGFRISLEMISRNPQDPKKDPKMCIERAWVLGKGAVGYFGAEGFPGLPGKEWRCFPSASKWIPPTTAPRIIQLEKAMVQLQQARLQGGDVRAEALGCWTFLQQKGGDIWKMAYVLTELAGSLRQQEFFEKGIQVLLKALELCPSYWEAYLEMAHLYIEMKQPLVAIGYLQRLLSVRPKDGRAATLLLQLLPAKLEGLDRWLRWTCRQSPLLAEYVGDVDQVAPKVESKDEFIQFHLEDQKEEVHAYWTLPRHIRSKDLDIRFKEDWLGVRMNGEILFEATLAHQIRPTESSWTFSSPDLTVMLCKCPVNGKWPRWEVLEKEDVATRLERLGGLPFDQKAIRWL